MQSSGLFTASPALLLPAGKARPVLFLVAAFVDKVDVVDLQVEVDVDDVLLPGCAGLLHLGPHRLFGLLARRWPQVGMAGLEFLVAGLVGLDFE